MNYFIFTQVRILSKGTQKITEDGMKGYTGLKIKNKKKREQRKRVNIMMRNGKECLLPEYYDASNDGPKIRRF
jgi:hypothetical protein